MTAEKKAETYAEKKSVFRVFTGFAAAWLVVILGLVPTAINAATGPWHEAEMARVRLLAGLDTLAAGASTGEANIITAAVEIELAEGWKTYWRSPGDAGLPPVVDFSSESSVADGGYSAKSLPVTGGAAVVASHQLLFPVPERFTLFGLETYGYSGRVVLPLQLQLGGEPLISGQILRLRGRLEGLVCSDICVPLNLPLALDLAVAEKSLAGIEAQRIAQALSRVPRPETAAGTRLNRMQRKADRLIIGIAGPDGRQLALKSGDEVLIEAVPGFGFAAPDFEEGFAEVQIVGRPPAELDATSMTVTVIRPDSLLEQTVQLGKALSDNIEASSIRPLAGFARVENTAATGGMAATGLAELASMLLVALLGGLVLNVMPCVLPVLSLKLTAVLGHAGGGAERGRLRCSFVATAGGIVSSFLLLGVVLLVLRQAGVAIGWGIQFQQPVFLAVAALAITLFGVMMLDLVTLPVPQFITMRSRGVDGLAGDFFSGMLATLLATPCSAPFVGTAVTFGLAAPAGLLLLVFAAMGLGLAAPWLLVAWRPQLVLVLPAPGPWLVWLRRGLALGLFGTAIWLVSVLLVVIGEQRPAPAAGWQPWAPGLAEQHVAEGRLVLVDVTADWCISCKANKLLVLETAAVKSLLDDADVIRLQADWTRPDPAIAGYLASFGRVGIPFNAIYGPAMASGLALPELLTVDALRQGLKEAR